MSLAHYFTFFRILLIPFFPLLYFQYPALGISSKVLPYVLIAVLGICEFTDLFDGFIARRKNQVTDLGKVLDPMADSIMRITVFLTFTKGIINLPLVLVFVFMYREFFISTLRTLCAMKGMVLAARISGKIKAFLQGAAAFIILFLMLPYEHGWLSLSVLQALSMYIVSVVAVYAVISAAEYVYVNRELIQKAISLET